MLFHLAEASDNLAVYATDTLSACRRRNAILHSFEPDVRFTPQRLAAREAMASDLRQDLADVVRACAHHVDRLHRLAANVSNAAPETSADALCGVIQYELDRVRVLITMARRVRVRARDVV